MIGCHSKMGYPALDHGQNGIQNAANGADFLSIQVGRSRQSEEVPEQLIGSIDQVNCRWHFAAQGTIFDLRIEAVRAFVREFRTA